MNANILVADDEHDILELVRVNLERDGFRVALASSGRETLERLAHSRPDLLILDLMLPDVPGMEVCRRIRRDPRLADLPVILLTARSEEIDRIVGLELGADDYITKPFSPRELSLRVQAILRRSQEPANRSERLESPPICVDLSAHRCMVEDQEVLLTAKEFELLVTLMRNPDRVLTRDQLLHGIWGSAITVTSRTIDTHLKRLRSKLGAGGDSIETIRGVGYRFRS